MKVLEIVHGFPPAAQGGAEIYARAHAIALHTHLGDDVVVFTREQDPSRAEYDVRSEHRDGLRIVSVNNTFRRTRSFEDTYRNEVIGRIAEQVIDDVRPDVAHIHHLTCLSTTIVRSLAARGIPCFFTLHDYWLICHRGQLLDTDYHVCEGLEGQRDGSGACRSCLGPAAGAGRTAFIAAAALRRIDQGLPRGPARHVRGVAERLGRLAGQLAPSSSARTADRQAQRRLDHMREVCADVTHFIAPSRHMRDRFVTFGIAPDRITVAGYGFDHAPFATTPTARIERSGPQPLRLGFVGSLMISKAPHLLLEAIRRVPSGAVTVDLFGAVAAYHGDDSYRQQLEPLLRLPGVRMHDAMPHERIALALSSIDLLVVPSIWPENSPLVIQEVFLAGVPVIAARIGGIPELVDEGRNGLLFRAGDAEDLARVISRLLTQPKLLETLRSGIPAVRTIEDDVRFARQLYEAHAVPAAKPGRIAAVVLNFHTPDDTFLAVTSLLASRRPLDDIIVVDNDDGNDRGAGDRGDYVDGVREALRDVWPGVRYVRTRKNLGFSGGMNAGIREALARGADRVLLVNSDVIVPPDCVSRLNESLTAVPRAGIAGPVVLMRSSPDRIASLGMSYRASTGRMQLRGAGSRFDAHESSGHPVVDGVSGCLMLVAREVFEAVGLLHEDYFFGFEDLDFCLAARRAGFVTVLATAATVYHEGGRSIGAQSPRRLYFAARNHLLMAQRAESSSGRLAQVARASSIVSVNLAHAVRSSGGSLPARLTAVVRGTRDYVMGRFGAG